MAKKKGGNVSESPASPSAGRSAPLMSAPRPAVGLEPIGTQRGPQTPDLHLLASTQSSDVRISDDDDKDHPLLHRLLQALLAEEHAGGSSPMALRDLSKALAAPVEYVLGAARVGAAQGLLALDEASKPKTIALPGTPAPGGSPPPRAIRPQIGSRFDALVVALDELAPDNARVAFAALRSRLLKHHATRDTVGLSLEAYLQDAAAAGLVVIEKERGQEEKIARTSVRLAQPGAVAEVRARRFDLLIDALQALSPARTPAAYKKLCLRLLQYPTMCHLTDSSLDTYLQQATAVGLIVIIPDKTKRHSKLASASVQLVNQTHEEQQVPIELRSLLSLMRTHAHITVWTLRKNFNALPDDGCDMSIEARIRRARQLGLLVYGGGNSSPGPWVRLPEHAAAIGCALCSLGRY